MKKRFILTFCLLVMLSLSGTSQLLTENFNAGSPAGWQQSPAASWSLNPNFGTSGSGCIVTENTDSAPATRTISTPTLNLGGVTNLTVNFQVATVKNNFINPDLVLYYDGGLGPQFLARWGTGFTGNTTYTLSSQATDYTPPLDAQNVYWEACTHTIAAIGGTAVSFMFEADMFNGGYVLLDEIVISGITSTVTALPDHISNTGPLVFQNPVRDKKLSLKHSQARQLSLFNQLGQQLLSRSGHTSFELDLSGLPAGVYYLAVLMEDHTSLNKKVIVE